MNNMTLGTYFQKYFFQIVGETLFMVGIAAVISIVLGLIIGAVLFILKKGKSRQQQALYKILSFIINVFRSFPFVILMFALTDFTRSIMRILTGIGTSTSNGAAIVPLSIAAIPFFAKIIENALVEVNGGIIEAATSLGLSQWRIMTKVVIREALPSIVSGVTLSIITLIGFSAIVSNIGAGGIGGFAYTKGYVDGDKNAMIYAVITIIVLVQLIQICGNKIYKLVK